jgi:hypothetical protein
MEILIAFVIAFYVTKNGVIDTAYAMRGKPSPRQRVIGHLVTSRRPGADKNQSAFRRYVRQLWDDSWDQARDQHVTRHGKRRARRQERQVNPRPAGAARHYLHGRRDELWERWDRGWDTAATKRLQQRTADAPAPAPDPDPAKGEAPAETATARPAATSAAPPAAAAGQRPKAEETTDVVDTALIEAPVKDSAGTAGGKAGSPEPAEATPPTPQEEPTMTTTGETTTLSQTLGSIQAWEASTRDAITSLETSIASLQGADVGAAVTGPLGQAQEAFGQALAAFAGARDGLGSSVQIGDLYASNPDAGSKDYVSS